MPDVRTAVARRDEEKARKQKAAARYIESLGSQIARALPAHLNGDRMTRLALTAVRRTPDLAECSDVSMAGAILTAAALGLEPNTPTQECYLVPYAGEVTLIVGYQGFVKLFWQHPLAASLRAEAVYEADDFAYTYGTGAFLRHTPNKRAEDRGQVIYYYAHATLKSGAEAFVVLTPEEVKALRKKEGPNGNIPDPQLWMERKTCIRQLFKMLPKTPNMALAARADEAGGTELYRAAAAERAGAPAGQVQALEGVVETSTGEVITPDPDADAAGDEPPPPDPTAKATQEQMDRIHGLLRDHEVTSDAGIREAIGAVIGRPVTTRKGLLAGEADTVIAHLEQLAPSKPAGGEQQ